MSHPRARTPSRTSIAAAAGVLAVAGVLAASPARAGFVKVDPAVSGLDVQINGTGREDWGYGAAWLDCNGDGILDLYVANQDSLSGWLFQQNANHVFTNIAVPSGCADTGNGRGVKFADYDNDGDEDIFIANYAGPNRLYRNNGDGTFTDVADSAMASGDLTFGGAWGDFNADGYVDLYVVNRGTVGAPQPNQLFVNNRDGTFTERAHELGVDDSKAGLEAVWLDYDNDGFLDLYLSNDKAGGNRLWHNNGDGTFTDVSVESGANIAIDSMGIGVGDYDGNGFLDLYMTNTPGLTSIKNVLLRNNGDGTFTNVATPLGVQGSRYGWGCSFLDYDNDGYLDIYVVNWMTPLVTGDRTAARNVLYHNNGDGTFTDVSAAMGVDDDGPGYGVAVADYNNDGFVDMFVVNNGAPSILYRNVPTAAHWLKVKTVGTTSNRDGIGARVTVITPNNTQFREVSGGQSYLCQPSLEVEFGLGAYPSATMVQVRWPSGIIDRYENVAAGQTLTATEGETNALIVSLLDATVIQGGVRVRWDASRETGVDGFRVYRMGSGGVETVVSGGALLPATTREFVDASVQPGHVYQYAVAGVESGVETTRSATAEVTVPAIAPAAYVLEQNQPNPFNPGTTIWFDLPEPTAVKLSVFNAEGKRVAVIVNGTLPAGRHSAVWNGMDDGGDPAASGVYFYRLESALGERTRKMVLVK